MLNKAKYTIYAILPYRYVPMGGIFRWQKRTFKKGTGKGATDFAADLFLPGNFKFFSGDKLIITDKSTLPMDSWDYIVDEIFL